MLLGLNEELERVMGEYRRNRNGTEKNSVFNMIAMSLAAGGTEKMKQIILRID